MEETGTQDIFIKTVVFYVPRGQKPSNQALRYPVHVCITDNYPVIYNQYVFVHWGKNRNGYFTEYMGFTFSLEKIIRELIRSYDSLL